MPPLQPFAGVLLGNFEGDNFGVVQQVVLVPALAGHLPGAVQNHAAHGGVGRADGDAAPRQLQGALHPVTVLVDRLIHKWVNRNPSSVYGARRARRGELR